MTDARERYDFPTRGLLTKAERWMYPGGRPNGLARLLNRGWAIVHSSWRITRVSGIWSRCSARIRTGCSTSAPPVDRPCCAMAAARPCAWRRSTPALGRRSCADSCRSRPGRGPSYRSLASEAAAGVSHQVGVSIVGCERVPLAYFPGEGEPGARWSRDPCRGARSAPSGSTSRSARCSRRRPDGTCCRRCGRRCRPSPAQRSPASSPRSPRAFPGEDA